MDIKLAWAANFAAGRKAATRIDSFLSKPRSLQHGLPQGSPASPILVLLFIAPLHDHRSQRYFGYVDDVALLGVGNNLQASTAATTKSAHDVITWCHANGLCIAENKTELQHFHFSRAPKPETVIGAHAIKPKKTTRWLDYFLDKKLSFNEHVNI
ncbi:hypothetical protein BROUX41_000728 [Berkeleyomyces rouxiae]